MHTESVSNSSVQKQSNDVQKSEKKNEQKSLTSTEKVQTDRIMFAVVAAYCRACTWIMTILVLFFNVMSHSVSVATNLWLAEWSSSENVKSDMENGTLSKTTACDSSNSPVYVVNCYCSHI